MEPEINQVTWRARLPLVWWGRLRHSDTEPVSKGYLERHGYRRKAALAAACVGLDPMHFYRADLSASSTVIDIGAYTGEVAADLHALYGCQIRAFEPNPQVYPELEARFVDTPEVTTYPFGLGASDAVLPMQLNGLGSTVYGELEPEESRIDVEIRDIASVLDELGIATIDFLKINIEGAEFDLLDRVLEVGWQQRTRYLLIQFHEWHPRAHRRRRHLRRQLRKTHDQVWNYPWVYELWCSKDHPHPPPPRYTRAQMAEIRTALAASVEERRSEAVESGDPTH